MDSLWAFIVNNWQETILFFIYIPIWLAQEHGPGGLIGGWLGMWLCWALCLFPLTHDVNDPSAGQIIGFGLFAWPMFYALWLYILLPMRLIAFLATKKAEGP